MPIFNVSVIYPPEFQLNMIDATEKKNKTPILDKDMRKTSTYLYTPLIRM